MRRARTALLILGLSLPFLLERSAAREPFSVGGQTPSDFKSVQEILQTKIPDYLEESQCGGWNLEESVEGRIATVWGVPGRRGQWNQDILSGMSVRNNQYEYPASARGKATVCSEGLATITKMVWDDGAHKRVPREFGHPYFENPPCRWRPKDPALDKVDPPPYTPDMFNEEREHQCKPAPLSPPFCEEMCGYLNEWKYTHDCAAASRTRNVATGAESEWNCDSYTDRYLCSDLEVEPNCQSCTGESCRCPGPGCNTTPQPTWTLTTILLEPDEEGTLHEVGREVEDVPIDGTSSLPYASYYRRYDGAGYRRNAVPTDKEGDVVSKNAAVACYGFYSEFDPKVAPSHGWDRRCVINMDVYEMYETQQGKGTYGQESKWLEKDPNPDEAPNQRDGEYNKDEDLWYENLGAGFSLLSEKVFQSNYGKDLAPVFLDIDHMDRALPRVLPQLSPERPFATANEARGFDETAQERTLTVWWQKQEATVAALVHRPVVRLLLPTGWAIGADPTDPLFSRVKRDAAGDIDRRDERIEVQIDADEDTLGEALGYIERSLLLKVEEEPVPVVVPMGSPTEFRAIAESWCTWWMRKNNVNNCDNAPGDILRLMQQLEKYADRIEDVRVLRGELARYAGEVLKLQKAVTQPLADWVSGNIDAYKKVLGEQKEIASMIESSWQPIRQAMNDFHTKTNRPWCMNQRFTLPIYSMLDDWMTTRVDGSINNGGSTPMPSLTVPQAEDVIIDLSLISYMTGSIALPVLKPVQLSITNVPTPPSILEEHSIGDPLPDLPSLESIQEAIRTTKEKLPKPPEKDSIPLPSPADMPQPLGGMAMTKIQSTLDEIMAVVDGMNERYRQFWDSIGPLRQEEAQGQGEHFCSPLNMKHRLECQDWDSSLCQHVEMDLIERFTRIASRPDVQLKEDYESLGPERIFSTCPPENHVCSPVHAEGIRPRVQWEIIGPKTQEEFIDELRKTVRDRTLPSPVGAQARSAMPRFDTDIQELLPIYDVPGSIDLTPPSSSSSSASLRRSSSSPLSSSVSS